MRNSSVSCIGALVMVLTSAFLLPAEEPKLRRNNRWENLETVKPGSKIIVRIDKSYRDTFGKTLKGKFASFDDTSMTIQLNGSQSQTIPKEAVRRLIVRRKGAPWAPWAGLAIGSAIGIGLASNAGDFTTSGAALVGTAYFGPPGLVVGYLVHRNVRTRTAYRPPYLQRQK